MLAAFSETTDSTGRMACTQDGNSTGASASSPSAVDMAASCDSCGDASDVPGSGRESQSGISIESKESTSSFDREVVSLAGEKRLESMLSDTGVPAGKNGSSCLGGPDGGSWEGSSQSKRFSAGGRLLSRN